MIEFKGIGDSLICVMDVYDIDIIRKVFIPDRCDIQVGSVVYCLTESYEDVIIKVCDELNDLQSCTRDSGIINNDDIPAYPSTRPRPSTHPLTW